MAVALNALTLKIGSDTSGLSAGVKAVRSDINRVNRVMRRAMTDTDKMKMATQSLSRIQRTGALTTQEHRRALEAIKKTYGQATKAQDKHAESANRVKRTITSLLVTYGGFQAVRRAFGTMVEMEQASVSLEVLTGSATAANQIFNDLKQLDRDAPSFGFAELQKASQSMLTYGVALNKITPATAQLSEISAGSAEKLASLSLAFAQVTAQGRLMGQEVRQFVNAGFNPLQQISEDTGISMAELKKQMEAGGISTRMVEVAMKNATSEGGRFFEMNERLAASVGGAFSQMSNTITMAAADLASVFGPSVAFVARQISAMVDSIRSWATEMTVGQRRMVVFVTALASIAAVAPMIIGAITTIVAAIKALRVAQIAMLAFAGPAGWAVLATGAVIAAGAVLAVESAMSKNDETLKKTTKSARSAAEAMEQYGMAAQNAGKPLQSSTFGSQTAVEQIEALRKQNQLLEFGAEELLRQKMEAEGISAVERFNLSQLQKRNAELKKSAEMEKERKAALAAQKTALETRRDKLKSDADGLREEAKRIEDNFKTPFQVLTEELAKLNRMRMEGMIGQRAFQLARREAVSDFGGKTQSIKLELPPSIGRGSREEYQLIANRQNKQAQEAARRHREMIVAQAAQTKAMERAAMASEESARQMALVETAIKELNIGEAI